MNLMHFYLTFIKTKVLNQQKVFIFVFAFIMQIYVKKPRDKFKATADLFPKCISFCFNSACRFGTLLLLRFSCKSRIAGRCDACTWNKFECINKTPVIINSNGLK